MAFETGEPYIWLGENDGSYDEGGNQFRAAMLPPWPEIDNGEKLLRLHLGNDVLDDLESFGAEMSGEVLDDFLIEVKVTARQLHWLANLPPQGFACESHVAALFQQIVDHDLGGFIPLDNRRAVLGD